MWIYKWIRASEVDNWIFLLQESVVQQDGGKRGECICGYVTCLLSVNTRITVGGYIVSSSIIALTVTYLTTTTSRSRRDDPAIDG